MTPPVGSLPLAAEPGFGPFHAFPAEALFAGIAVFAAIGALSFESERPFSAAIVYVGLGIAGAVSLELLDFGWLTFSGDAAVLQHVAEFALIVALFGTGSSSSPRFAPPHGVWWRRSSSSRCRSPSPP